VTDDYPGAITFNQACRDITRGISVLTDVYAVRLTPAEVLELFRTRALIRNLEIEASSPDR
jgi:hypothetical protein